MLKTNQTFILFTYGEMWLLNKISCEIQILNEKVGKLMIENGKLEEENKKLKSDLSECECSMHFENDEVGYRKRECKKLKAELKKYKEQYQHSLGGDDEKGLYV